MAVGRVGAGVAQHLDADAPQAAVPVHGGLEVELHGVAGAGVDEDLFPGEGVAHRAAVHRQAHGRHQRLHHHVLLGAEAAADEGLDHLHPAPGQPQGLGHHPAHDVGDLGGAVDDDAPVAVPVGEGGVVLQVAVLDHAGLEVPFEHPVRARQFRLQVPVAVAEVGQHVAGPLLVQRRRPFGQGRLGGEHARQHLVVHPDQAQGLLGGGQVHRHHRRHRVPHEAGLGGEDEPVGHVPVVRVQGPGVPGRAELDLRQVLGGEHRLHPRQGPRLGGVHPQHPGVGVGTAQHFAHQHVPLAEILRIARPAGDLVHCVQTRDAPAYDPRTHGAPRRCLSV